MVLCHHRCSSLDSCQIWMALSHCDEDSYDVLGHNDGAGACDVGSILVSHHRSIFQVLMECISEIWWPTMMCMSQWSHMSMSTTLEWVVYWIILHLMVSYIDVLLPRSSWVVHCLLLEVSPSDTLMPWNMRLIMHLPPPPCCHLPQEQLFILLWT